MIFSAMNLSRRRARRKLHSAGWAKSGDLQEVTGKIQVLWADIITDIPLPLSRDHQVNKGV
jgi:hypothetical protein